MSNNKNENFYDSWIMSQELLDTFFNAIQEYVRFYPTIFDAASIVGAQLLKVTEKEADPDYVKCISDGISNIVSEIYKASVNEKINNIQKMKDHLSKIIDEKLALFEEMKLGTIKNKLEH